MRRSLGKGLTQLLGETQAPIVIEAAQPTKVPLASVVPNAKQPRRRFDQDKLEELASSIREFGVLQPIVVRPVGEGKFELIAGERRWRASQLADLSEIPVVIRTVSSQDSLEIAIVENVQREDISAIECAQAYRRLSEEFGLTQEQISQKVGKSRVAVANTIRLLQLPESMQRAINDGTISEGHGRALLMQSSPLKMAALFGRIVDEGLSVRQAEQLARDSQEMPKRDAIVPPTPKRYDPQWSALAESFCEYFGSPAKLIKTDKGGKLQVEFFSDEDLQRILDKLGIG